LSQEQRAYSRAKFLYFYSAWWLFWGLVQTFVLHRLGLNWKISLVDSAVSNILLGVLAGTAFMLYSIYHPGNDTRYLRILYA
jgi:hypothetical protein